MEDFEDDFLDDEFVEEDEADEPSDPMAASEPEDESDEQGEAKPVKLEDLRTADELETALEAVAAADRAEAEARKEAVAQAEALLGEESGETPRSTDVTELRDWVEAIQKLQENGLTDDSDPWAEAEDQPAPEPVDFTRWDSASFGDLVARVTGQKPIGAPRGAIQDEEFGRALALLGEE